MSASQAPVPIATLLTHREWVRRLARSLVRDDAAADDVEQRTWLAAMRSPPTHAGAARQWLARVVRSQALNAHRAADRRDTHERTGARGEAVRSAADVVAEAEIHKRLVVAVLALDEPYRTTVLLRFFEDLPPRDVALRMGVPAETVRTRVRRAAETLRGDLAQGGGREAWLAALAPIVGVRFEAGATAGAAAAGGTVMAAKATIVTAVALALAAGYAGGRLAGGGAEPTSAAEVAALRGRIDVLEGARAPGGDRRAAGGAERRVAAADARVAEQDRRIETLETQVAELRVAAARAPAAADPAQAAAEADADLAKLKALDDAALLAEMKRRYRIAVTTPASRPDVPALFRACDVLLTRPVDTMDRVETLISRAMGYRVLDEAKPEEAAFREALAVAGPTTVMGRVAATQLGWTASRTGDKRAAAEWFLSVARQTGAEPLERARARVLAANVIAAAGDSSRARDEYRTVVDEFGASDEEEVRKLVDHSRKAIERIDGGGR